MKGSTLQDADKALERLTPEQVELSRRLIAVRAMGDEQDALFKKIEKDYRASRNMIRKEARKIERELKALLMGKRITLDPKEVPVFDREEPYGQNS